MSTSTPKLTKARMAALEYLNTITLADSSLDLVTQVVTQGTLSALMRGGHVVVEEPGLPPQPVVALTDRGRRALARAQALRTDLPGLVTRARARLRQVMSPSNAERLVGAVEEAEPEWQQAAAAALIALPQMLRVAGMGRPEQAWASSHGCVVVVGAWSPQPLCVMHPRFVRTRDLYGWLTASVYPKHLGRLFLVTPARWRYWLTHDGDDVVEVRPAGDARVEERRLMEQVPCRGWMTQEQAG